MADDTDEHEFQIEGQTLQCSPAARSRSSSLPDEDEEAQHRIDLQKIADDKLLTDADIAIDGMGEEEKRQILWALRESMPAAAPPEAHTPSSSLQSSNPSVNDNDDREDEKEERKMMDDIVAPNIEDPVSEEGDDRVCDSSTSAAFTKTKNARLQKMHQHQTDSASKPEKPEVKVTRRRTRRQQSGSDGDASSSASEKSEDGEGNQNDLCKLKSGEGDSMKLSTRQKELSQTRFKDLFNKTNLSWSQQSNVSQVAQLSSVKEGLETQLSQDLFADHLSEEQPQSQVMSDDSDSNLSDVVTNVASPDSASVTAPSRKKKKNQKNEDNTPSPIQVLTEDSSSSGSGVVHSMGPQPESQVVDLDVDDVETQPPENVLMVQDEGEDVEERVEEGAEAKEEEDEDNGRISPVYPAQLPSQASLSSSQPQSQDRLTGGISPAKLALIDDKDKRPLLHDNWFSWPHIPPICQLQRSYRTLPRKRKESPHDIMPYCCPELESPVQISTEMLKVFDAYFPYFTSIQHCFKELPWGKPVRPGLHLPDTLDVRKRGERAFCFEDDDLDDFKNGQPPAKKLISADGLKKQNSGLSGNNRTSTRKNEEDTGADSENGGASLGIAKSLFEAETQPYDTDELPDIQITPNTAHNAISGDKDKEVENTIPGTQASQAGSQGSNSMLNEQGELYSTQLPHRKRRAETGQQEVTHRADRPKRLCTQSPHTNTQQEQDADCISEQQLPPFSRKRKQAALSPSSDNAEAHIYVSEDDDDDGEISFPHRKKINIGVSKRGFVHISSAKGGDCPSVSSVVQPSGLQRRRNRSGGQHPVKTVTDMGDPPVKQSASVLLSNVRQGELGVDSDDSVQFVDPTSIVETAVVETKVTETAIIEKKVREVGTLERRVTETMEKKVTETSERRIVVHPQASRGAGEFDDDDDFRVASASRSQSSKETKDEEVVETVMCPLCNLEFPIKIIEQHASDCTGEVVESEPPLLRSAIASTQMKRRPLRDEIQRQEFVCKICQLRLGSSGALTRHFEKCWQREEASTTFADQPAPSRGGSRTVSTRSSESWLDQDDFHIPRKVQSSSKGKKQSAQPTVTEEAEEYIEECSDDSSKDPDFAPSKDDKKQEKEDEREDEGLGEENETAVVIFKPISKLTNNPFDFHNQFTKKPRKRLGKSKDKQS